MTNRENQHRLDQLALQYLAAVETEDFDTIDALWEQAADDADLDAMLHGLNAELVAEQDAQEHAAIASAVLDHDRAAHAERGGHPPDDRPADRGRSRRAHPPAPAGRTDHR